MCEQSGEVWLLHTINQPYATRGLRERCGCAKMGGASKEYSR